MSLRELAEADLEFTLENPDDFGWPISLTDPTGSTSSGLFGQSGDIHQVIDPDTGQAVSGRLAHVSLRISSVIAQVGSLPKAINDADSRPWLVVFEDLQGEAVAFRVMESNPDRTLGLITLHLEAWLGEFPGMLEIFYNDDEETDIFYVDDAETDPLEVLV